MVFSVSKMICEGSGISLKKYGDKGMIVRWDECISCDSEGLVVTMSDLIVCHC